MRIFLKPLSLLMASFMLLAFPYPVSAAPDEGIGLIKLIENASIPVWAPNGDEILFTRNSAVTLGDPYYGGDIYKINLNDSEEIRLTNFYYNEEDYIWSPDGTRILYGYDAIDNFYLYIMNSDGSENFELAKQSYGINFSGISGAVWAPDGSKIAYIAHGLNGSARLITLNPDGSDEQLTASANEISALAWSPDSSKIAFKATNYKESKTGIYLTNLNGSESVFLAEGNIRQQTQPWKPEVWSEDGSKILYSSNENGNYEIYSINIDGSEKKQLTDNNSEDYSPCFSPNESRIIFVSDRTGYDNLWIMDSDGSNEEELTEDFEGVSEFSWSPDGKKIAFSSNFEVYIQEIIYAETDDESPENPDSDTDNKQDYLNMEILSPELNFSVTEGTPELITVNITNSSGSPVQSSGFKSIIANFSNGDPELQLFDDGTHWDTAANDSVFSNRWIPVNTSTGEASTSCTLRVSAVHETLGFAEQVISGTIFRLPTPPDLVIEDISWNPENPYESDNITFRLTFANRGTGASEACTAKCYINGSEVYSHSLPELEAGSNTSITFNWVPDVSGNLEIKAVVDTEDQVSESEEENNEKDVTLSLQTRTTSTSSASSSSSSPSVSERKSSSGSSGGGAGGSSEPASNVRIKELSQQYITNGKHVKFTFQKNVTCITYVAFDSKRTTGKTTTIIEMLKNKSTFISELPSGEVYENVNIWVGNKGTTDPENIENAVVGFRVEKNWINSSNVDPASVRLWRFSNEKWEELSTRQSGEDVTYIYLEADTPGFSSFVITALQEENKTVEAVEESSPAPSVRSLDLMGALTGKLAGKQNSTYPELSRMDINESNSDLEVSSTASKTEERITGRDVLKALTVIALLAVTGFLGALILRKQD